MIFRKELAEKVLRGEKTVTRRPVKLAQSPNEPTLYRPCRYKVGRDYALRVPPEKGSKARARTIPGYRLRVLSVERERLGIGFDGGFAEARREGFPSWNEFRAYWIGLYGTYDPDQLVDRIEFELVEAVARG